MIMFGAVCIRKAGEARIPAALKMLNDATDAVPCAERRLTTSYMSWSRIGQQDVEKKTWIAGLQERI
jgi:hypothetical protein